MACDTRREVTIVLTAEHLRLITEAHQLKPTELDDPAMLRSFVQKLVDQALGFPQESWHQWDDWAKGLD